jgi:hypothetical protein
MAISRTRLWRQTLLWGLAGLLGCGCARSAGGNEKFIPQPDQAHAALDSALQAWQQDRLEGDRIPGTSPAIQMSDTIRKPGQKLDRYDILGEAPGDGPRCYAVRLVLAHPREEITARYVVIGIDPLWVIRHEDYEMLEHWDHAMMLKNKEKQAAAKGN